MPIEKAVVHGEILNAVQVRNIYTCEVVEIGGDTSPILWDAYLQCIYDIFQDMVPSAVTFSEVERFRLVSGQFNLIGVDTLNFAPTGILAQEVNSVAMVLIGKALGVRRMGRKFFSGLSLGTVLGNSLTGGALALAVSMLAAYVTPFTGIGGGTITPGILDKTLTFRPFVGGIVSTFLGSMRRRKPGVGI